MALATLVGWIVWPSATATIPPIPPHNVATAIAPQTMLPGRNYVTPAQLHEAMQAGEIDRPVKSLLKIDKPLEYGGYRWDDTGVGQGG